MGTPFAGLSKAFLHLKYDYNEIFHEYFLKLKELRY